MKDVIAELYNYPSAAQASNAIELATESIGVADIVSGGMYDGQCHIQRSDGSEIYSRDSHRK